MPTPSATVISNITGGKISIGVRLSRTATDTKHRGIWFTFDGTDTVTITEPDSKLTATVKANKPASVGKLTVKDKPAEPDTTAPKGDSTETPDTAGKTVVWKYSTRLKVMIVATGVVVGLSLYAAVVVPFFVKKKRAGK